MLINGDKHIKGDNRLVFWRRWIKKLLINVG